jgi:hypothetical protein
MENPENVDNTNNPEQQTTQEPFNFRELIESLKELLKEVNINEVVNSFNGVKVEKIKSDEKKALENLKSQDSTNGLNIKFWTRKFIKEFAVLSIILIAICYLSYNNQIDANSIGTLLGSIIGYAVGNFNSSNKEH